MKHITRSCHNPFNTYLWESGEKFCNHIFSNACFTF